MLAERLVPLRRRHGVRRPRSSALFSASPTMLRGRARTTSSPSARLWCSMTSTGADSGDHCAQTRHRDAVVCVLLRPRMRPRSLDRSQQRSDALARQEA